MRGWMVAVAALLAMPMATAAILLEDPAGDLRFEPGGAMPPGHDETADLLRLDVDEGPTLLRFHLWVTPGSSDAGDGPTASAETAEYTLSFRRGTNVYEIRLWEYAYEDGSRSASSSLYALRSPGDPGDYVAALPTTYVAGEGHYIIDVDRADLRDDAGLEPFRGQALPEVWARSQTLCGSIVGSCTAAGAIDRMPDEGSGDGSFTLGAPQAGHARLSTEGRVRASNGAATTYLWSLNLTNTAEAADAFTLSMADVPGHWQLRLPYPTVQVPGNASVFFPILVTVPFQHQHGAFEFATLTATSLSDPHALAGLDLGIEFLATPQPAGHHDTVFLHTARQGFAGASVNALAFGLPFGDSAFINTDPDDPRDQRRPVPAWTDGTSAGSGIRFGWVVPLDPGLRLGLDADMDDVGSYRLEASSPTPVEEAWLEGRLVVVPADSVSHRPSDYDNGAGVRTLATLESTSPRSLAADEAVTFSGAVLPHPDGDLIPFHPDNQLVLVINVRGTGAQTHIGLGDQPVLHGGGELRLPLAEYHDPIDASFAAPDFISLTAAGSVQRDVAPGGSALWNLSLANAGQDHHTFSVTVTGEGASWARLPGGDLFLARANRSVSIPVAVQAPADALSGDRADIIVEAVNVEDPRMRGLLRLTATVAGDGAAVQDDTLEVERIEAAREQDTPAPLPLVLMAGLALLAVRRRR